MVDWMNKEEALHVLEVLATQVEARLHGAPPAILDAFVTILYRHREPTPPPKEPQSWGDWVQKVMGR